MVRAIERQCTAMQIFCGNPRGLAIEPRAGAELEAFRKARAEADLAPLLVHACYLINPCAPERGAFARSVRRLATELTAAAGIGAEFYIIHPGSPKGRPMDWAVRRAAACIAQAAERAGASPMILLEDTASDCGPGGRFETLAEIASRLRQLMPQLKTGLCLDSCHAFAAGYDLRDAAEADRMVRELDLTLGVECVRALHVNDSRDPPGSGRDRHAHIGKGTIGRKGLRNLLRHPRLQHLPLILETPWESLKADLSNIRATRRLAAP